MTKKFTFFLSAAVFTITSLFAQDITVSGTVTDVLNNPLPGASVQVKGTSRGTATDFDGRYEISASQGDVLVFSSLGYETKELPVEGSVLNVNLNEDLNQLDQVVVTAFGIERETRELGYSVYQN